MRAWISKFVFKIIDRCVEQFAELGVILLMFGVGLHFHLKDLIAVQKVAVPGAVVQISVATVLGVLVGWMFGWSAISGLVFGMAISVASTVVLTRVLEDNQNLHTPGGRYGRLLLYSCFTSSTFSMSIPAYAQ